MPQLMLQLWGAPVDEHLQWDVIRALKVAQVISRRHYRTAPPQPSQKQQHQQQQQQQQQRPTTTTTTTTTTTNNNKKKTLARTMVNEQTLVPILL